LGDRGQGSRVEGVGLGCMVSGVGQRDAGSWSDAVSRLGYGWGLGLNLGSIEWVFYLGCMVEGLRV